MNIGDVWRIFKLNYGRRGFLRLAIYFLRHPGSVLTVVRIARKRDWLSARSIFLPILNREKLNKDEVHFNASLEIRNEANRWLRKNNFKSHNFNYSVIIPVFKPKLNLLEEAVRSVTSQTNKNWEIILIADGIESANEIYKSNTLKELVTNFDTRQLFPTVGFENSKISLIVQPKRVGIRDTTIAAIKVAKGDRVVLLDQDDLLNAQAIDSFDVFDSTFGGIYTDHAVVTETGVITETFRKPKWSPFLAHQIMYFGHSKCFRKDLIESFYTIELDDLTADHIAMLKIGLAGYGIAHIPLLLAAWRINDTSLAYSAITKPEVMLNFEKSISEISASNSLHFQGVYGPFFHRLAPIVNNSFKQPALDIIIPTMWSGDHAIRLLNQLKTLIKDSHVNIILIDTNLNSRPTEFVKIQESFGSKLKVLVWDEKFNYSKVNNFAFHQSDSEDVLFLNDDTRLLTYDTFRKMQAMLAFPGISAVGAKLLYENGTVQHGGVALGIRGTADHMYRNWKYSDSGVHDSLNWSREVSAVTAACLLTKRKFFSEVGGFDEEFDIAYQDLDLCLKLSDKFGSIVQMQSVFLLHMESVSRGSAYSFPDRSKILSNWHTDGVLDPFTVGSRWRNSSTANNNG